MTRHRGGVFAPLRKVLLEDMRKYQQSKEWREQELIADLQNMLLHRVNERGWLTPSLIEKAKDFRQR